MEESVSRTGGAWFNDVLGLGWVQYIGPCFPGNYVQKVCAIKYTQYTEHRLHVDLYARYV